MAALAARPGVGALLIAPADQSSNVTSVDAAIKFSPGDPEPHLLRGEILETQNDFMGATGEYEQAVRLRPDDYVLWITLARARELYGDRQAAIAAGRNAIPLAPHYAQPHWQLGNLLVRAGEFEEGFNELRAATASNSTFLSSTIDLAWQLSGGDPKFVERMIQPKSAETFNAVADHFRRHGEIDEAVLLLEAAGNDQSTDQVRRQFVSELIKLRSFKKAFELWCGVRGKRIAELGAIDDGGFENETDLQSPGFGWRAENTASTLVRTLDASTPQRGTSSLRIEFNGESEPTSPIISQLVKTDAQTHYQLSFAFRSEDLISGGLPKLLVIDGRSDGVIAETAPLLKNSDGWRDLTVNFVSGSSDSAVKIVLVRESCSKMPCPIFGRLWLDSFALRKQ
ncbi:MAG: tetratricopeptide repeat protein [Pyrinomonadaceae bacterium]